MSVCYCGACPNCLEAIRRHEDTVIAFENHRRESTKGLHESKERKTDLSATPCEHDWKYEDDEYGSLAAGGSYEIYRCTKCGKRDYAELPD